MNTHTIVADIRQDMLNARKVANGQNLVVSDARSLHRRINSDRRLDSERVSDLDY